MLNIDILFSLLEKKNIKQSELSKATGISTGNISDWKKGKSFPSAEKLLLIADYLGCSTDYLLGRTDNPNITVDTYINGDNNNNGTQAINGNVSVTAHAQEKQQDSLTEQFLQRFDSLSFEDKLVIMQHVQDIKKSPSDDGN